MGDKTVPQAEINFKLNKIKKDFNFFAIDFKTAVSHANFKPLKLSADKYNKLFCSIPAIFLHDPADLLYQ